MVVLPATSAALTESECRVLRRFGEGNRGHPLTSGLHLFTSWCALDDDAPSIGWSAMETELVALVGVDMGVAVGDMDKRGACSNAIILDSVSGGQLSCTDIVLMDLMSQTPANWRRSGAVKMTTNASLGKPIWDPKA